MKIRSVILALLWFHSVSAAELGNIDERVAALEIRAVAAEGMELTRSELLGICSGLEGARWCEGYIAAILASLKIPRDSSCLPMTDMAPFMYGNIWELTQNWMYRHPEVIEITLLDAVLNALNEQEQCKV